MPTKSFAIAEQNNAGSGITSETTATFDSTGNTHLVVYVKHEGASQTITPSDNKGSTGWSSGTKQGNRAADSWGQFHWVKIGTPGTGHTVTISFTSASFVTILVWLVNSSAGELAQDAESVAQSPSDTTAIDAGSLVTSGASVVSFMGVSEYAVCTYTAGSGWTEDHDTNGPNWTYGQSRGPETTTPIDPVATGGSAMDWATCAISFREVSGTTTEQEGFRFRDDDGSETTATWLDSQDSNITRATATNTRLRVLVNATGDLASAQYRLEYKLSTDSTWSAVPLSSPVAGSVDVAVTLGTDDAQQSTTTMTLTGTTIGASLDSTSEWVGIRFQNVTIPVGATVTAANISVVPSATTEDEPLVTIFFEDADNPGTFTTGASNISNRSRTSSVSWSSTDLGASGSSYHDSPDLSSILQTVVNRGGWASGNAVVVIIQGGATTTRDLTIESFENAGANPPLLHVDYTVPSPIAMSASANITASGESTTAQLTAPSGKTTSDFVAGRMQDDENPADAVDITTDDYTELEWCITATAAASNAQVYEFRVTTNGTPLDTYSVTPSWTIGTAAAGLDVPRNISLRAAVSRAANF